MRTSNEDIMKNVRFDKYCKFCQYKDIPEDKDPCKRCLEVVMRAYTGTPLC